MSGTMDVCSLPVELFRAILAYLSLADLGRCGTVCRAWRELILGLDKTLWRQLFWRRPEWRHPSWPIRPHEEPPSWREALRKNLQATRIWSLHAPELDPSSCLHLFRRRKECRLWHVGAGCEHKTLRGALGAAGAYDRVLLHPGVYEEQAEVVLKVPVEVIGNGKFGEVTLLVSIDQQCPTARFCNLVLMPPWFSPVIYKTSSGHVQLDSCNLEGGQLQIRGPGTCLVRFCSFGRAGGASFQGVSLSLLENCDFSGSNASSVTVEGAPVLDRNWAWKHLSVLARSSTPNPTAAEEGNRKEERTNGTNPPCVAAAQEEEWMKKEGHKRRRCWECREDFVVKGSCSESEPSEEEDGACDEGDSLLVGAYTLSHDHHSLAHLLTKPQGWSCSGPSMETPGIRTLQQELQLDQEASLLASSIQGCVLRGCLFRDGKGGVLACNGGRARLEGNAFRGLHCGVRCVQNARIVMLRNEVCGCWASGVFLRLSAQGLIAENDIHTNGEAGLDIRKGANSIVLCNRIHGGLRSGIVVLGNGKASIRSNKIYGNKEAGIYILYKGNPVVRYNVIEENQWGGVDVRRGGDPVLRNNFICHGYSDGVVLGDRSRGLVEGNHIYCNKGCGVWVMSSSLTQVSGNHITHNGMYGVAVFCHKDEDGAERGAGGSDHSFSGEGELLTWEGNLEIEDEPPLFRRPISITLVESNCVSHNGGAGLYVRSNEALNVVGNAVHSNLGAGVSVLQSDLPAHLLANCIASNSHAGVTVETGCCVELRGNGIYDNGGHGVSCRGDGQIVENDVVGNGGCGIRLMESNDIRVLRNRVQPLRGCGIAVLGEMKGAVENNTLFQGSPRSSKPLLYQDPSNSTCLLSNNTLRACSSWRTEEDDPTWALDSPPPRPQLESRSSITPSTTQRPITTTDRISARVESAFPNRASIVCAIL
ncbi:F-box only protein 10-like [Scleropages formosus]|uniref:F-box only protein 10-like n=1 Tax=Scleropages formosus TaxID=113540 RepID=A0A0P7V740_SCLFO|nr:F-box only protein 10-like [Scleropages formosus]